MIAYTPAKNVGRWHAGMMCFVREIITDPETHTAEVNIDEHNAADMTGTIAAVRQIDPAVWQIDVYADGEPDVRYVREDSGWTAWLIEWRVK